MYNNAHNLNSSLVSFSVKSSNCDLSYKCLTCMTMVSRERLLEKTDKASKEAVTAMWHACTGINY